MDDAALIISYAETNECFCHHRGHPESLLLSLFVLTMLLSIVQKPAVRRCGEIGHQNSMDFSLMFLKCLQILIQSFKLEAVSFECTETLNNGRHKHGLEIPNQSHLIIFVNPP